MLLFLALMIVYIIWYQVKWNELKKTLTHKEWLTWTQVVSIVEKTISGNIEGINKYSWSNYSWINMTWTSMTWINMTWIKENINETWTEIKKINNINMLSWTNVYYGKIDIVEKLGIKYQYALIDSTWTWFIYLGTPSYDFASIARALDGNIYTIATEQEIIENKLFGTKIVFLNIPEYKDKQVIMFIYTKDGIWLIQIEYNLYHTSKAYLKSLFIN